MVPIILLYLPASQLATLSLSLGGAAAPAAEEGAGGYKYWPTKGNFKYASSAFLLLVHRVPSASLSLPVLLGACRLVLCHGPPLLHLTLNQIPLPCPPGTTTTTNAASLKPSWASLK